MFRRLLTVSALVGCTNHGITAEPEAGFDATITPPDGEAIDALVDSPDGSSPPLGGYTQAMVACPDASVRWVTAPAPNKKIADLFGVVVCIHIANGAFPNGATIQCNGGAIIKDGEVGYYCPNANVDYVIFAIPN